MQHHLVLKVAAKLLLPFILLFALYVQFHGEFGPGGGFQGGVIFGAGIILYALVFGAAHARAVIAPGVVRALAALGVLLYAGVGAASLPLGGNFLDYSVLAAHPVEGRQLGIHLIELGVGLTVAAVMILLFYAFAGTEQVETDRDDAGRDDADRDDADRDDAHRDDTDRDDADRDDADRDDADRDDADRDDAGRDDAGRAFASRDGADRGGAAPAVPDRDDAHRAGTERTAAD